jgi:hypothetical protein
MITGPRCRASLPASTCDGVVRCIAQEFSEVKERFARTCRCENFGEPELF